MSGWWEFMFHAKCRSGQYVFLPQSSWKAVILFMSLFFIHLSQSITGMIKMRKHIVAQVHIWFLALQAALERWEAGSTGPSKLLAILQSDTDSIYTHSPRISYESIKSLCSAAAA
jgi:hypothetical protein